MKRDYKQLLTTLSDHLQPIARYKVVIFIALVIGLYGYVVLHINQATAVQPSASQSETTAKATPHIDPKLVQQLQQLQDNSVGVKALFNDARSNPFQ